MTLPCFRLDNRTALVTGASRGIGRAIAVGFAEAGADIVAVARTPDTLEETRALVAATGRTCHVHRADVTDPDAIDALHADLEAASILPDILVNNAGMEEVRPAVDVDAALWDRILDTNLKGAFFVARGFARRLLAVGAPGAIVNTCSLTSAVGVPTAVPYTASKSGLLGLTRALATEWAARGIRVNGIGPGYFRTELTEAFYRDPDWQRTMLAKIPMGRFGELPDLLGCALFLASDASAYVTGELVFVDGGYMAAV
jgi:gluconate 5-dehydrogenase